ncbi:membrane-associated sulfatase [Helicobacter mustelae]|nr:DUF1705 domain-containing protein [Helicobacter mustelae]STP13278.1 membrane-associated sulfatase [Helicobacter mustelae]
MKNLFGSYHFLIFLLSIYFVIFYHQSFWSALFSHTKSFPHQNLLLLSIGILLCSTLCFCLELLCTKRSAIYVLGVLCALSAVSAYAMDTYHISISPLIIDSILHTNLKEARGVFDLKAMLKILALLAVPFLALFLMKAKKCKTLASKINFCYWDFICL